MQYNKISNKDHIIMKQKILNIILKFNLTEKFF